MAYKDYSDERDYYASPEWQKAFHIYTVVRLYYANCKPKMRFTGVIFNILRKSLKRNTPPIRPLRHSVTSWYPAPMAGKVKPSA